MAEKVVFTAPQQVTAPANQASVVMVHKRRDPFFLKVQILDEQGRLREFSREGTEAQNLIVTLNKSNNSVKSEERRILEYLQAQGDLPAGTYTGSPD